MKVACLSLETGAWNAIQKLPILKKGCHTHLQSGTEYLTNLIKMSKKYYKINNKNTEQMKKIRK
jgi:hypothetical protein